MDQAEKTMMDNIQKNTGKSFDHWLGLVKKKNFAKHSEIVKFLKEEHGFTYGYASLVALKSKGTDAGSADSTTLIEKQYKGKEHFKPLYDNLISEIKKFGKDVEIAPKNSYVSLRRKRQFAILQPATKTRFEVQLNLKGEPATGLLESISAANAMCTHKINLDEKSKVSKEVIKWVKTAYDKAG
jgi:predicted transport protein